MKSCNSKTVETLKHCPTAVQKAECVCTKSRCISITYIQYRYVHITLWMNNIKILYSIWNNPRADSLPFQRTSERHYLQEHTHMNTFTFQNNHKCQSDYSPGQSATIWLERLLFPADFCQSTSQTEPKRCRKATLCRPWQPLQWEPVGRPGLGSSITQGGVSGWSSCLQSNPC